MEIILPVGISFFTFHGISYSSMSIAATSRSAAPRRHAAVHFVLPAARGRADRARGVLPAAAGAARPHEPCRSPRPLLLILGGLFKKVVIATYLATDLVDPVFFDADQLRRRRSAARGLWLRGADLLRFSAPTATSRSAWPRCSASASRPISTSPIAPAAARVLAPLAHLAVELAARLSLHAARRQPGGRRHLPQPDDHDAARRHLARRGWKFVAWGGLHGGGLVVERWLEPWSGGWPGTRWPRGGADGLSHRLPGLDPVPRRQLRYGGGLSVDACAAQDAAMQATPFTVALIVLGLALHAVPRDCRAGLAG